MKKAISALICLLLLVLCSFALADVAINETNFPDATFREYIMQQFDADGNGSLSTEEIASATYIYVDDMDISSLKGVEYFTSLQSLDCNYNSISSLDLSKNTALETLNCFNNKLTSLDVSKNTALQVLHCGRNPLTSLNVGKNAVLKELDCWQDSLSSLDVSGCPALESLDCDDNELASIDLSNNTALIKLGLRSNSLTSLDISKNTALDDLWCGWNQLTSLDVSHNTSLRVLICGWNKITSLDISKNTILEYLSCNSNSIASLDVSRNTALETIECGYNPLGSIDVSRNTALEELDCQNTQLTSLNISKNYKLRRLNCEDNALESIDVTRCLKLNALARGSDPSDLDPYYGWETDGYPSQDYLYIDEGTTVITSEEDPIPDTSLTLNKIKATLTRTSKKAKPTLQLTVTIEPEDTEVEWSSSNPKVAKVDKKGKVTALKKGTAIITCTAKNGSDAKVSCKITVKDKLVKKITLNKTKVTIRKGKTFQLKVKALKPSDAFNQKVKWSSSNKKVATVDKNGKINAKKKGTCTITCTAANGSKIKAICKITVK